MKRKVIPGIGVAFGLFTLAGAGTVSAEEAAGKKIFLESNCQACHTVASQGIKTDEGAADAADASEKDDVKPPDLSDIGIKAKADFMDKYLIKKETIEGRKHKKGFKGTDAERQALVAWLCSLQSKSDKPAEKAK